MTRLGWNRDWYFTPAYDPALPQCPAPTTALTPVRLPHGGVELPLNCFSEAAYQLHCGYVRFFTAPAQWRGQRVAVTFEGAAHHAKVYCNGVLVGEHRCGYTAFTVELTSQLRWDASNNLTVELDSREQLNVPPFGHVIDYLTFCGLYREVYLEVGSQSYVEDLCVRADDTGAITCLVSCVNPVGRLRLEVRDRNGQTVAQTEGAADQDTFSLTVAQPKLWSCESPNLYTLHAHLETEGHCLDSRTVRFGFRRVVFSPDGLYLNGRRIWLRGLNRHQSWPYLGYAVPGRAQQLDADILKFELGCDAVRTSHYPQSHHFLDRCDEIGLLVFTEIPGWQHLGDTAWQAQALVNTEDMVRQYRNHPSIFLWGVRINESADADALYQKTNAAAHRLDPTRPTGGVRNFKGSRLWEDVYTYNDFSHHGTNPGCDPRNAVTKERACGYLISEHNGHMFPTKAFDDEGHRTAQALRHAQVLSDAAIQPGIGGCFGWCMFDYNTHRDFGSGDHVCYHGVLDAFRNPKTAAWLYASQQDSRPVLEVGSTMDIGEYPGGAMDTVAVFTNADFVRLYRNDQLVGTYSPSSTYRGLPHPPILITDTIGDQLERLEGYSPHTAALVKDILSAMARFGTALPLPVRCKIAWLTLTHGITRAVCQQLFYRYLASWGGQVVRWRFDAVRNDAVVASVLRGPGEQLRLEAIADTLTLQEGDCWDMATVRMRAVDEHGTLQSYCARAVTLEVSGAVDLIGPRAVPLCGGMAGCYLRTNGTIGQGKLVLSIDGAPTVELIWNVLPPEPNN